MITLEIARKFVALGENTEAVKAYKLVLNENAGQNSDIDMEAVLNIL